MVVTKGLRSEGKIGIHTPNYKHTIRIVFLSFMFLMCLEKKATPLLRKKGRVRGQDRFPPLLPRLPFPLVLILPPP